jgi:hypothetical protein
MIRHPFAMKDLEQNECEANIKATIQVLARSLGMHRISSLALAVAVYVCLGGMVIAQQPSMVNAKALCEAGKPGRGNAGAGDAAGGRGKQ